VSRRLGRPALGASRFWPHWRGRVLAVALPGYLVLLFALVLPYLAVGRLPTWSWPLAVAHRPALLAIGLLLSVLGLAFFLIAQTQMGTSWRLNLDREAPGPLRRDGLFRFSRHPVYLGVGVMVLGISVALLSALSLVTLALLWATLALQAREEEAFLLNHFGSEYAEYAARVGRFVPGFGRL
jgi:protein-S-isoprenylcysteine O-methyltransferase Ste14